MTDINTNQNHSIPHLTTALTGPLLRLESHLLAHQTTIEDWFRQQWQIMPAPFTCSVDVRNAGFKLSPVDTNLFPAGFNNLNPDFLPMAIQAAQSEIGQRFPGCKRVLIVPESHTRNPFYLKSLAVLRNIILSAGYEVRLGSLIEGLKEPLEVAVEDEQPLLLEPIIRRGQRLLVDDFDPSLIILNNDLSAGIPASLQQLEQPIAPPPSMGWVNRSKTQHFHYVETVSDELAACIDIDPWLIKPLSQQCGDVDFLKRQGEECLVHHSEVLFAAIKEKYAQYQIKEKPFVVIKADAGTYGMGVMMIQSPDEIRHLNRKQRTRMSASKGSQRITKVIIQEGVHSFELWQGAVAEPVVYLLGQYVIGGFYRVHKGRGPDENLNAPGMHFEPLSFAQPCHTPDTNKPLGKDANRFYSYSVIARLAALAAARERNDVLAKAK